MSRALAFREQAEKEISEATEGLVRRAEQARQAKALVDREHAELRSWRKKLDEVNKQIRAKKELAEQTREQVKAIEGEEVGVLERLAGESAADVTSQLAQAHVDQATADAAHLVRSADISPSDSEVTRAAQRLMEIAVGRYQNHFLIERRISNVPVQTNVVELLTESDGRILTALQETANVQMHVAETGDAVRLEGLDGVGREVARRALSRMNKKPQCHAEARNDPEAWGKAIREQLNREIQGLGRKAFSVLKIPRPHEEIVDLVGRLKYRTSYTQNQWLHAVEASFICGMLAQELGLDVRLARRATLMHDIGKALTHEMDGSHALIGADIARRLGESDIVTNAIGAHHGEEPPISIYAYLVAGADALSGARPGARREHADGFSSRLEDLERIGASYHGVDCCYAVHGGRELRVYVREDEVSDEAAERISAEIAEQVSDEMAFQGRSRSPLFGRQNPSRSQVSLTGQSSYRMWAS